MQEGLRRIDDLTFNDIPLNTCLYRSFGFSCRKQCNIYNLPHTIIYDILSLAGRYLFRAVKYLLVANRIERDRGQMNDEDSLDIRSACEVK